MTVSRALVVLGMMVVIGVAVVLIREDSAKAANRVQRLHQEKLVLSQRLWAQEMELAKLRGPEEIRRRADELGLNLRKPVAETQPASRVNRRRSGGQ